MLCSSGDFLDFFGDDPHALFNAFLIPDGNLADSADTFLDKLRVNFIHVLLEFFQYELIIFVVDDSWENLYFFIFDVVGISEFGEEALDVIFEDWGAFFNDVLDVFEDDVLDLFGGEGDHRHDRRGQFLYQVLDQFLAWQVV